jgi:hypothetical protein
MGQIHEEIPNYIMKLSGSPTAKTTAIRIAVPTRIEAKIL